MIVIKSLVLSNNEEVVMNMNRFGFNLLPYVLLFGAAAVVSLLNFIYIFRVRFSISGSICSGYYYKNDSPYYGVLYWRSIVLIVYLFILVPTISFYIVSATFIFIWLIVCALCRPFFEALP